MDIAQNNVPAQNLGVAQPTETNIVYASFGERLVAAIIDGIILGVIGMIAGLAVGISSVQFNNTESSGIANLLGLFISTAYYLYFNVNKGATPGKSAMGLRLQNKTTGANLDYVQSFLREVVGKFLSSIVLFIGYLNMLWDPNKQTWHDKLADSVVIKVKKS